ncbi:MAG: FecR domain-containing protein [Spirochaetales bacterium]|nr:FecR domain-containing protein [Spirochaetales bacterium]
MKRRKIAWIAVSLALVLPAAAQPEIGSIAYLEEGVEIDRDRGTIPPWDVSIGMEIENYDLLRTDQTGYAEVELDSPRSAQAIVRVSPNTIFHFEMNRIGRSDNTMIGLISGSLSVKVARLSGRQSVEVATESAIMGIRGTDFGVTVSPGGDILVTAAEGRVSCIDDSGQELFAEPGTAVEKRPGELFREIPVAVSDLETFRRDWYGERLEALKSNALRAIQSYAGRYLRLKDRFDLAYADLRDNDRILDKWYEEQRRGEIGGRMESLQEKKELIGDLLQLRRILYIFERVYHRLIELEDYYSQGYGRGQIEAGLSSAAFFQRFDREKSGLAEKMAEVRYLTKLYAKRNDGNFPTDLFEQGEEEFFGEEESLFEEGDTELSF